MFIWLLRLCGIYLLYLNCWIYRKCNLTVVKTWLPCRWPSLAQVERRLVGMYGIPQPKDQKNYQFVQKYEYRHSVQDYNNITPSQKTHSTNPVTRSWKKWNIQNYVQGLPQSLCRADKSELKIKIPRTHTLH